MGRNRLKTTMHYCPSLHRSDFLILFPKRFFFLKRAKYLFLQYFLFSSVLRFARIHISRKCSL